MLQSLKNGTARNFVLQCRSGRFHGFLIRRNDRVVGYVDRCPHAGLPLAHSLDDYLTPDEEFIVCDWHGAIFSIESGYCVGGPCAGKRLTRWPVEVLDGWIVTA